MTRRFIGAVLLTLLGCASSKSLSDDALQTKASRLAQRFLLIDTHVDTPYRLREIADDISRRSAGNFDYEKAREGGLDLPFMSIYIPSSYETSGGAKLLADTLIGMVESWVNAHPDKFVLTPNTADVRRWAGSDKIGFALGMENGSPLEGDLANVRYFYNKGIRYITLTHGRDNHISDSSYDTTGTWKGLSPFGREVVREMNRVGMMIDVSHLSDRAFWDVLKTTEAPVIASHSSCRRFTPGWERNMSDEMIKGLAANGGVIMINFGSSFITDAYRVADSAFDAHLTRYYEEHRLKSDDDEARKYRESYRAANPLPYPGVSEVADHIDHVVKLVGIDHVGFGSDFDGVGDSLPMGLKDASQYPNLIAELLRRGYRERDIEKICGLNLMRVWSKVESLRH